MADLRIREVAERLGVDPKTVRNWLLSGKLEGYRLGKLWMIPEESIRKMTGHSETQRPEGPIIGRVVYTYPDGTSEVTATWVEDPERRTVSR